MYGMEQKQDIIKALQMESWKLLPDASGYTKIVEMILRVLLHILGHK